MEAKDRLIALLQGQVMQLATERRLDKKRLAEQDIQLHALQQLNTQKDHTIGAQAEKLSQQQSVITEQNTTITTQQTALLKAKQEIQRMENVRYELMALKKWIFGIKSEKQHQPAPSGEPTGGVQLRLSLEADSWGTCKITDCRNVPAHLRVIKKTEPKKRGGRHDFPEGLEEEITLLDVADRPANARCIGHVDQRQLACDPMRWYIKVNRRLVYMVPQDEDKLHYNQLIAPLPAHPIAKCKMDISVLVLLTIEKFLYHLPVWRQQQRLRLYGVTLPYSTLCYLVNKTCAALEPLWHLLLKEITQSGLMHVDETRYRVLDNSKKKGKKSHMGWMWSCLNPVQRIVCFTYQHGRGKKDISAVLKGYKGNLLTDAYAVYTKYGRQPGVTHQNCLSHARRYFYYALAHDAQRANYALDHFFGPLYGIEQACKLAEADYDAITIERQAAALPILQRFRQWLEAELPKTTRRTPIYKAIAYALNNFSALVAYTSDGMLSIDNNLLEGQIRSIALGRANYMFAGSHRGGELAAIMYSFMATCKLHQIDPAKWLDDVLRRIADHPEDKRIELLPQYWKPMVCQKAQDA